MYYTLTMGQANCKIFSRWRDLRCNFEFYFTFVKFGVFLFVHCSTLKLHTCTATTMNDNEFPLVCGMDLSPWMRAAIGNVHNFLLCGNHVEWCSFSCQCCCFVIFLYLPLVLLVLCFIWHYLTSTPYPRSVSISSSLQPVALWYFPTASQYSPTASKTKYWIFSHPPTPPNMDPPVVSKQEQLSKYYHFSDILVWQWATKGSQLNPIIIEDDWFRESIG